MNHKQGNDFILYTAGRTLLYPQLRYMHCNRDVHKSHINQGCSSQSLCEFVYVTLFVFELVFV